MPEYNPYAPPQTQVGEPRTPLDDAGPVWQQATLRLSGWLGLILAALVLVTFGLGFYSEIKRMVSEEGAFDSWKYREWIARMTIVGLACLMGAVMNWDLTRLRGRMALTLVTIVPIPALFLCYLLTRFSSDPRLVEQPRVLVGMAAFALPFYLMILFVLWSSKRTFSGDQARGGNGCLTILAALAFVFSEGVAFTALVMSAAGILHLLRLTP